MKNTFQKILSRLPHLVLGGTVLVAVSSLAVAGKLERKETGEKARPTSIGLVVDDRPIVRDGKFTTSFAPVVKRVAASVVKITTSTKARQTSSAEAPWLDNPMLRRFFGEEAQRSGRRGLRTPPQQGVGSGVVVTKDGYILTNNHVVDGADEVKVTLQDGRELSAKVIGKDPKSDVAVVKVDTADLPFIDVADSDQIEVGDLVLAVGNPFGIGQTVTMGIVSATGRAHMGLDYEDFIQTDAAINPGNSGGALVDADGRLIGINTAILSRSGGNQGIGFAIPTNLARDVMENLVKDGKVTRGYLGVMIQDITPALAKEFKLKDSKGALVGDVVPNGPAQRAGLKSGDIVVEFNGKAVEDARHLKLAVARLKPGAKASTRVLRDGSSKSLEVTVREMPGSGQVAKAETNADDSEALKGVAVGDLDEKSREQFKVPDHIKGAVVLDVAGDSAASEAGLKAGDIIVEINKQPVKGAEDAVRLTENPKDKTTLLRVWSDGGSRFVVVDESKAG